MDKIYVVNYKEQYRTIDSERVFVSGVMPNCYKKCKDAFDTCDKAVHNAYELCLNYKNKNHIYNDKTEILESEDCVLCTFEDNSIDRFEYWVSELFVK